MVTNPLQEMRRNRRSRIRQRDKNLVMQFHQIKPVSRNRGIINYGSVVVRRVKKNPMNEEEKTAFQKLFT